MFINIKQINKLETLGLVIAFIVCFIDDESSEFILFKTVILDGALPRKTFSIGHSNDKRYYLEARKIK